MVTQRIEAPAASERSVFATAIVPVTEAGDSFGALQQVLRLSQAEVGQIVLAGLLPPALPFPDPDVVRALLTASEFGCGGGYLAPPRTEAERDTQIWRSVLWPLRRRAQEAGFPASAVVLRGESCADGIRRLAAGRSGCVVMLGHLDRWYSDLDQVARDLLCEPPCALRIAARTAQPRSLLSVLRRRPR